MRKSILMAVLSLALVIAPAWFATPASAATTTGIAATVTAGQRAAAAPPLIIRNSWSGNCLDHHFNAAGQPTTSVYAWPTCHGQTNQQWIFQPYGPNTFKVVNVRSGWCLSAPENSGSKVFAEVCVNAAKQVWGTSVSVFGDNVLAVQRAGASCMYMHNSTDMRVVPNKIPSECRGDLSTYNWYWW